MNEKLINRILRSSPIVLLFLLGVCQPVFSQVRLPKLVSDHMVLQRDSKLKIWGWASPGEKIGITFNGKSQKTSADNAGNWQVIFPPMKAGGPYTMKIEASNTIEINDILIGDVWLCSGQSNMVHYFDVHKDRYINEIQTANYPQIRQFLIPTTPILTGPQTSLPDATWKVANPENVLRFSVIAYFFAKDLYDRYQIPIGLINSSVGGTPIEAWTSENGLKEFSEVSKLITENKDTAKVFAANRAAASEARERNNHPERDQGLNGQFKWFDSNYKPTNWKTINIPGYWEDQGVRNLDGVVWYRKEIDIPAAMLGKPVYLEMGRIVDADQVYVNGQQAGSTGYQYPQRRYNLQSGILKEGKNLFVIRVQNNSVKGGFVPDKPYRLTAGNDTIDMKGTWHYKVGEIYLPFKPQNQQVSLQNQPTSLFNGMISPLINYSLKGVLWYQGESNAGRPDEYGDLQKALISDWRNQWEQPTLPFLFVQLPNFMEVDYLPAESNWAEMRQAQLETLKMPNTGMAVAIDLGEWNDIHPGDKKPIGDRLALAARKLVYGESNLVSSGPIFKSATIEDNKIKISFDDSGSGLTTTDNETLRHFAIAGADKKFVWASAKIEGNKVIISSDEIVKPVYIRYAWADNPDFANLCNKEGLPASPFEAVIEQP